MLVNMTVDGHQWLSSSKKDEKYHKIVTVTRPTVYSTDFLWGNCICVISILDENKN